MNTIYRQLQSGSFYLFISRYSNVFIQIIITSILARLIAPEDFGIIAVSMVFILFFNQFSDIGFGTTIVQSKNLKPLDINSFFIITCFQGVIFTVLFIITVPFITSFYGFDKIYDVLMILSISIFFYSINTVPEALNKKEKKFKLIGIVTVVTNIITGIIAILMAYFAKAEIYALVYKIILDGIIIFFLNIKVSGYKPRLQFSIEPIKRDLKYTTFQFLYSTTYYFSRNLDNMIIGKFLGAVSLGYYDKAYKLMIMPVQNLSNIISPVLHPVLTDISDNKNDVSKIYLNIIKLLALVGFPLSIYLFYVAEEVILFLYGVGWEKSIKPFKFLALSVGFQMIMSSTRGVFQALGKTKEMFFMALISVFFFILALYISINYFQTISAVGIGISIAYFLTFIFTTYTLMIKILNINFLVLFKVFVNPIILSLFTFIMLYFNFFKTDNMVLGFILKSSFTLLLYIIISIIIKEKLFLQIFKKIIPNKIKNKL